MSEYLLGMIGTVLLCALLTSIFPQGKTAEIIKSVARLACLVAILAPILRFFVDGGNLDAFFEKSVIQTDWKFIEYCSEKHIENAENLLESSLYEEFSVMAIISIQWRMETDEEEFFQTEKIKIEKINVQAQADDTMCKRIQEAIEEKYQCDVEVRIWESIGNS